MKADVVCKISIMCNENYNDRTLYSASDN